MNILFSTANVGGRKVNESRLHTDVVPLCLMEEGFTGSCKSQMRSGWAVENG